MKLQLGCLNFSQTGDEHPTLSILGDGDMSTAPGPLQQGMNFYCQGRQASCFACITIYLGVRVRYGGGRQPPLLPLLRHHMEYIKQNSFSIYFVHEADRSPLHAYEKTFPKFFVVFELVLSGALPAKMFSCTCNAHCALQMCNLVPAKFVITLHTAVCSNLRPSEILIHFVFLRRVGGMKYC